MRATPPHRQRVFMQQRHISARRCRMKPLAGDVVWPALLLGPVLPVRSSRRMEPAKWPISGLLSAEYPMIRSAAASRHGPQPAHDARPHPHRVFDGNNTMQQRLERGLGCQAGQFATR